MALKKAAGLLLRAIVTCAAIWLAFKQVSFAEVSRLLISTPWYWLAAALFTQQAVQYFGALRTRYYLHCAGMDMAVKPSLQLHYVGGLYNMFLPGGAGGDIYKVWWLKNRFLGQLALQIKLMIASRLNGFWTLGVLICALALLSSSVMNLMPYAWVLACVTILIGTIGYHMLAFVIMKEPRAQQYRAALRYSMPLQLCLLLNAAVIALGIGIDMHLLEYLVLFMLSCVLAMLPISIGGIGVRELTMASATTLLGLSEHLGTALAFAYTLVSLSVPILGAVIYALWKPGNLKD